MVCSIVYVVSMFVIRVNVDGLVVNVFFRVWIIVI